MPPASSRLSRALAVVVGAGAYAASLAVLALLAAVLTGAGWPRTVDHGPVGPVGRTLAVDLVLLLVFGVQHSVMARPAWKRALARVVPAHLERSVYVLASSVALLAVVVAWRPIPAVVWSVERAPFDVALRVAGALGLALAAWATFQISHAELFGLRQVYAHASGRSLPALSLMAPLLYRIVRHPMQLGFVIAFWATPLMTVGRLVLAVGMTAYILVGIHFEERELICRFGETYLAYRRRVPRLVPWRAALAASVLVVVAAAGIAPAAGKGATRAPGLHRDSVIVGGRVRRFAVHVPAGVRRAPGVIVALHGARGNGALMRALVGGPLERIARERGMVVAYPDGWGGSWNDCRRGAPYPAKRARIDDVVFVAALADRVRTTLGADPRVHVVGFSNGAQLALRLALEAPDRVRGVVAVGATLPVAEELDCAPSGRAARVIVVAGTDDPINPYDGGVVRLPTGEPIGRVRSAHETAAYFGTHATVVTARGGGHDPLGGGADASWWRGGAADGPLVAALARLLD